MIFKLCLHRQATFNVIRNNKELNKLSVSFSLLSSLIGYYVDDCHVVVAFFFHYFFFAFNAWWYGAALTLYLHFFVVLVVYSSVGTKTYNEINTFIEQNGEERLTYGAKVKDLL